MDAPDVVLPAADYDVEEYEDSAGEDAHLAFSALLQDVLTLRAETNKLWNNYTTGPLHLSPVAVASNTAVDLARQMEEEISHITVS